MTPPITYTNFLGYIVLKTWDCPKLAQRLLEDLDLRVEMRWNGHSVRPPVGMRADEASHRWVLKDHDLFQEDAFTPNHFYTTALNLVPQ